MQLTSEQIASLETPCVVIDVEKARGNCRNMQKSADESGCNLRPHVKTHKMPYFARMQLDCGAVGITCCKVSEAEVMADAGIEDIFIAYPQVGAVRLERAVRLSKRIRRLILAVDSCETAEMLQAAAQAADTVVEVRMEVDTGAKRTGVVRDHAVDLARKICSMDALKLTGIYTFKSLVYQGEATTDKYCAAKEEGDLMEEIGRALESAGIPLQEISAGSTPTGEEVAKTGKVTEIRPGTYIFNDYMLTKEGHCGMEDIAVRMFATVVSTPSKEYAVIDGGTKTFPMDIILDTPPYLYNSYVMFKGRPELELRRMNEEHGIVTSPKGNVDLKVGDVLELIPVHVCTAINMQNQVYLFENGKLTRMDVAARGKLL